MAAPVALVLMRVPCGQLSRLGRTTTKRGVNPERVRNLFKETFTYKDSQCAIIADKESGIQTAKQSIKHHRTELEKFLSESPKFGYTLKPFPAPEEPLVAKLMAQAAQKASVGPMAAVAGVLADLAVEGMVADGCKVAVVEDGGEISAVSNAPVDVAVAVGDEPLSRRFGFRLTAFPVGVGTSSGRFSHAFSFGDAEAATVFCREAGLADAAATAVANVVQGKDFKAAIERGIRVAKSISGVEGVMVLYKGNVGTWGKIPQIIKIDLK
ncbi:MAG: UPF0280 family protein [Candidatus Bathyarchaeota archaeon]|nr:UPF0280 family protein [Candidatus Bathyarchaeota archaeon]